jgi:hypothetical protein
MRHTWAQNKKELDKVESDMRLKFSSLKANWITLAYRQKQRRASH